jgi:hypothetical protein
MDVNQLSAVSLFEQYRIGKRKKGMNFTETTLPLVTTASQMNTVHTPHPFYIILAYFPGVARVFIYPNLIVICVTSLSEIAHLDGIFSIITSTLLGDTLPTRRLIYIGTVTFSH